MGSMGSIMDWLNQSTPPIDVSGELMPIPLYDGKLNPF